MKKLIVLLFVLALLGIPAFAMADSESELGQITYGKVDVIGGIGGYSAGGGGAANTLSYSGGTIDCVQTKIEGCANGILAGSQSSAGGGVKATEKPGGTSVIAGGGSNTYSYSVLGVAEAEACMKVIGAAWNW